MLKNFRRHVFILACRYAFHFFENIRMAQSCNLYMFERRLQAIILAKDISRSQITMYYPYLLKDFQKLRALLGECRQVILTAAKHLVKLLVLHTANLLAFKNELLELEHVLGQRFLAEIVRKPYIF